jgi:hypothetical protein
LTPTVRFAKLFETLEEAGNSITSRFTRSQSTTVRKKGWKTTTETKCNLPLTKREANELDHIINQLNFIKILKEVRNDVKQSR